MKAHSKAYKQYINSFDWYLKRRAALGRSNNMCQRCKTPAGLKVHHLTYERLGNEKDEDLLVVCQSCHKKEDAKRERHIEQKRWDARLDGWATKKYGQDWEDDHDYEDVEQKFIEWLERKEEEEIDY